jgi:hypothetical protein
VLRSDGADRSDGQLLTSFIEQKDEAAFETLVRRHGPMVFGVCRRIVRNDHDAEDAFQATFLVLALKAASVKPRDDLGNESNQISTHGQPTKPKVSERESICPGKTCRDSLRFQLPVDKAKVLRLELPPGRLEQAGWVRFQIPVEMIERK